MRVPIDFTRAFVYIFSLLTFTLVTTEGWQDPSMANLSIALGVTLAFVFTLTFFDWLAKHFSLRALNAVVLGSLIGYLFSLSFVYIINHLASWSQYIYPDSKIIHGTKLGLLIFGIYFGINLVSRASDELYMSIPLVRFKFDNLKKKDLVLDRSILTDIRLLDIAGTGILDHRLVIPRHIVKNLKDQLLSMDEVLRTQSRKALDLIKSLEQLPRLNIRYYETDFPEVKDPLQKIIKIARNIDADILTSMSQANSLTQIDDIRFINLQGLAQAMQQSVVVGEQIRVKIMRQGKEPSQGIAYLEDGSMVVVNGAGEFVEETVRAHVLSVKHSLSGRMVFCNLLPSKKEERETTSDELSSELSKVLGDTL